MFHKYNIIFMKSNFYNDLIIFDVPQYWEQKRFMEVCKADEIYAEVVASIEDGSWYEKFDLKKGAIPTIEHRFSGKKGFTFADFFSSEMVLFFGLFSSYNDWQEFLKIRVGCLRQYAGFSSEELFGESLLTLIFEWLDVEKIEYLLSEEVGVRLDVATAFAAVVECSNSNKNVPVACLKTRNESFYVKDGAFRLSLLQNGRKEHLLVWFEELLRLVDIDEEKYALSDEEVDVLEKRGDCMFSRYREMFGK